uniref:Uncharacterized protein n=1 Tax=Kalanchoe fedtschenkoi TaxID=63787 RepID=A0A7N0U6V6_KALFE
MACLSVSFSFSSLLFASELQNRASLRGRAACPAVSKLSRQTDQKSDTLTGLDNACGSAYYASRGYHQHTLTSRRQVPGKSSCISSVSQSAQTTISGFWTGPDFEDGWGFVEAYVNQTT